MSDDPELLPELRDLIASKAGRKPDWKPNAAFATLLQPDDKLALVVGADPVTRSELGRKLWDYIRENNLQDPVNRWVIHPNDAIAGILGGETFVNAIELMRRALEHVK